MSILVSHDQKYLFQGTKQIIPGVGSFDHFLQVSYDTVRLSMTQADDGGDYFCEARMGNNQLNQSQPKTLVYCSKYCVKVFPLCQLLTHCNDMCMSLSPTVLPTIMNLPAPMTHTEGERFELVCSLTGIPAPEIRWEKDGSVFLLGDGRRVTNSTGSPLTSVLNINSLALSDAGVYTCSVTNVAGNATRSVRLEVRGEGLHSK